MCVSCLHQSSTSWERELALMLHILSDFKQTEFLIFASGVGRGRGDVIISAELSYLRIGLELSQGGCRVSFSLVIVLLHS